MNTKNFINFKIAIIFALMLVLSQTLQAQNKIEAAIQNLEKVKREAENKKREAEMKENEAEKQYNIAKEAVRKADKELDDVLYKYQTEKKKADNIANTVSRSKAEIEASDKLQKAKEHAEILKKAAKNAKRETANIKKQSDNDIAKARKMLNDIKKTKND